jgi:hypothetical protein
MKQHAIETPHLIVKLYGFQLSAIGKPDQSCPLDVRQVYHDPAYWFAHRYSIAELAHEAALLASSSICIDSCTTSQGRLQEARHGKEMLG